MADIALHALPDPWRSICLVAAAFALAWFASRLSRRLASTLKSGSEMRRPPVSPDARIASTSAAFLYWTPAGASAASAAATTKDARVNDTSRRMGILGWRWKGDPRGEYTRGPLDIPVENAGPGHVIATNAVLPLPGAWTFAVTARYSEFDQTTFNAALIVR